MIQSGPTFKLSVINQKLAEGVVTPTGFRVFNDINDLANFVSLLLPIITHYNLEK